MGDRDELSIGPESLAYVEAAYADYLQDPASVSAEWQSWFASWPEDPQDGIRVGGPSKRAASLFNPPGGAEGDAVGLLQQRVEELTTAYRQKGHSAASLDPLGIERPSRPELDPAFWGLSQEDLAKPFPGQFSWAPPGATVGDVLAHLRDTYCRSIGVQYMHIDDLEVRSWLQKRMESSGNRLRLSRDEQVRILTKLSDAEGFEQFLHRKFPGTKRFSLEGGESMIPLMDLAIEQAGEHGIQEIVIGMAHRGRLNVLANIMGKSPRQIFREFQDLDAEQFTGRGDVKYHMGFSNDCTTASGRTVHLSLSFNPSHLECVGPVVIGRVRAKQDRLADTERCKVMGMIVHGDAAFAGQGVVQELFNMSELPGYTTGGTIHLILNNQIGFTTPPSSSRSTEYATDVARMLQIPVFHVNGEDPEGVAQVIRLAMDFRREFDKDVVIDLWCYRRYGHNEGDEPSFTQPLMYKTIRARKSVRDGYLDGLVALGDLSREEADSLASEQRSLTMPSLLAAKDDVQGGSAGAAGITETGAHRIIEEKEAFLEDELQRANTMAFDYGEEAGGGIWGSYAGGDDVDCPDVDTGVPIESLRSSLARLTMVPDSFHPHSKIKRFFGQRMKMVEGQRPLDWGAGEALAFASLLESGVRVRLSGQDCGRGTFSHRHAVLHDQEDGHLHVPLSHLAAEQGSFEVLDSPLSETGVLGFEYGYSLDTPEELCIWEAQFGDFVNVAQVIIDQFISSAEDKWSRLSALTMLLPHGFEGQGPEHSSARLERFLSLAAEDNMQVVNLTTPAQLFHCLRRQVVRPYRKPLVVMSPKSLLRHPQAVSSLEELSTGSFQRVLGDEGGTDPSKIRRILMCSGKLYYELATRREETKARDVAILRLEQLYPLREDKLAEALEPYAPETPVFWVQEEPFNMGAWYFLRVRLGERLLDRHPFAGVTRPESASPATGSAGSHKIEQSELIDEAFDRA